MRPIGKTAANVALIMTALLLISCASQRARSPLDKDYPPQVALFGDSLSSEAEPYYSALVHATGETALTYDSHGGTAICDWLTTMREVEAKYQPTAVELQFSGNALTPCMKGYDPSSPAYYEKYKADTIAAIDIFAPSGAHVYLIGAPITKAQESDANWDALNEQYAAIATADPSQVSYIDAGAAVEGPEDNYMQALPCLPVEPCLGPFVHGVHVNIVRSPDGAHFCPVEQGDDEGVIGGCSVYSSGAYRYARAMVNALATPVGSSRE